MITAEKIKIYTLYKGDTDGFSRGPNRHQRIIDHKEFSLIESLIQDIKLIARGLASEDYISSVEKKLIENCDNTDTINYLRNSIKEFL